MLRLIRTSLDTRKCKEIYPVITSGITSTSIYSGLCQIIGITLIIMEPKNNGKVVFSHDLLSLIRYATQKEDEERVKSMLESSDVHAVDESGYTLLHYSAKYCNVSAVKYLLKRKVQVDAQCHSKKTPLMLALWSEQQDVLDRSDVIKLLLSAGADVEFVHEATKKSILQIALAQPKLSFEAYLMMKALQKKCRDSEVTAQKLIDAGCQLYDAVKLKDTRILELMLERGFPVDSSDSSSISALHVAARCADARSVEFLLKHGADVDATDYSGSTPIGNVYSPVGKRTKAQLQVWRILVKLGTKVTSCSHSGVFQIYPALLYSGHKVIRALLESQVDFKAKEAPTQRTLLHYIVMNPKPGLREALKPHLGKFDLDAVDIHERSPLYYAAKIQKNVGLTKLLLDYGANPDGGISANLVNFGMPYLTQNQFFKPRGNKCLELLLQHYADPQFIATKKNGVQFTIFEEVKNTRGIKLVVEHLAMREKLDIPLTEITLNKIKSRPSLQKHFDKCRRLLEKKVCGIVMVWQLLTADSKKMAKYSSNQELVLKLNRISRKQKHLLLAYPYYYNTVKKRYNEGILDRKSRDKAAVAICRLLENRFDRFDIAVQKILDYLDNQSLQCLHLLDGTDDSSK